MKIISVIALSLLGTIDASGGAYAAQADNLPDACVRTAAWTGVSALGSVDEPTDVIQPPSSIDPGMALAPPQTDAMMPIIGMPGTREGRPILPR
jgi:hypothetical protein